MSIRVTGLLANCEDNCRLTFEGCPGRGRNNLEPAHCFKHFVLALERLLVLGAALFELALARLLALRGLWSEAQAQQVHIFVYVKENSRAQNQMPGQPRICLSAAYHCFVHLTTSQPLLLPDW